MLTEGASFRSVPRSTSIFLSAQVQKISERECTLTGYTCRLSLDSFVTPSLIIVRIISKAKIDPPSAVNGKFRAARRARAPAAVATPVIPLKTRFRKSVI